MYLILIILFIIFLGLFFGIRISLKLNKKKSELNGILKIIIFNQIVILKKEYPEIEEEKKDSKLKIVYNKIKNLLPKKEKEEEVEESEEEKEDSSITEQWETVKPLIPYIKKIIPRFTYFLKKIINSIQINKFYFHLNFGISNYAETAKILGYFWSFAAIPNGLFKSCSITAQPIFIEETIDFNLDIDIKIKLLTIIHRVLQLIINKDIFILIKKIIKLNRENNDK